jgi:4'-phosphopantetheinyl transferase
MITERFIKISQISENDYKKYFSMMSPEKQERVNRFRFEDDRRRTVAGEILARVMISEAASVNAGDIVFLCDKNGKPYAKDIDIHFNISHSGDYVMCAVNETPVGVDIEKIRDIRTEVINRVCTEKELEYVNAGGLPESERLKRFFEIWTFKEAYFKYLGTGISDFKGVDYFEYGGGRKCGLKENYAYCIIY